MRSSGMTPISCCLGVSSGRAGSASHEAWQKPRPRVILTSISKVPVSFTVQMWCAGLRTSTAELASARSAAVTVHGPFFLRWTRIASFVGVFALTSVFLRAKTISVTSSRTPGSEQNSCGAPVIRTDEIAQPSIEESRTRRRELPIVRA